MSFSLENQGSGTFLVYTLGSEEEIDSMGLGMLSNNKVPGLISLLYTQMDTTRYIKYNVSSKMSASQFFGGIVRKKQLLGIFGGIVRALTSAEEYMINPDSIVLNLDYMFSDVSTCETSLICLPVKNAAKNTDISVFLKNIMFGTQFDQSENCDYVAKIINYLNGSAPFSACGFKKLLDEIERGNDFQSGRPSSNTVPAAPQITAPPQPAPNVQPVQANQPVGSMQQSIPVQQSVPAAAKANPPTMNKGKSLPQAAAPIQAPASAPRGPMAVPNQAKQGKMAAPSQGKMAVPGQSKNPAPAPSSGGGNAAPQEKEISLMYLLQHYNKENAELYKAQKAAKKKGKASKSPAPAPAAPPVSNVNIPGANNQGQIKFIPSPPQQSFNPQQGADDSSLSPAPARQQAPVLSPRPAYASAQSTPAIPAKSADFGQTVYLSPENDEGVTVFLSPNGDQNRKVQPYLLSKRNNEKIPLNKPIFRIGRDADFNDYVVENNKFVGHSHCHIITSDGEYFIVDDNSKNRTFVDNAAIQPGVRVKLSHGQTVRLADEEFEFKMF